MTRKRAVRRAVAEQDILNAAMYYLDEGGEELALRFIDAVQIAVERLESHPSAGSPRYANWVGLEALRFWQVKRFPYLIFYVERADHVDVWRVLHAQRDIPTWLLADEEALPGK